MTVTLGPGVRVPVLRGHPLLRVAPSELPFSHLSPGVQYSAAGTSGDRTLALSPCQGTEHFHSDHLESRVTRFHVQGSLSAVWLGKGVKDIACHELCSPWRSAHGCPSSITRGSKVGMKEQGPSSVCPQAENQRGRQAPRWARVQVSKKQGVPGPHTNMGDEPRQQREPLPLRACSAGPWMAGFACLCNIIKPKDGC